MDWDDLRFFLEVEKHGTVREAARHLDVTHATVSRRLRNLEQRLGTKLFDRLHQGHKPTLAAEPISKAAKVIEGHINQLNRSVFAMDAKDAGIVSLSMPEFLAVTIIMPHLKKLKRLHPEIELQLSMTDKFVNLTNRESDIALRLTETPPDTVIAYPLGRSPLCIYASVDYLSNRPSPDCWVSFDYGPAKKIMGSPQVCTTVDGLLSMLEALKIGLGVGILPCFMGDNTPELLRLPGSKPQPDLKLWLLMHPDIRNVKRVKVVKEFLIDLLKSKADLINGNNSRTPSLTNNHTK